MKTSNCFGSEGLSGCLGFVVVIRKTNQSKNWQLVIGTRMVERVAYQGSRESEQGSGRVVMRAECKVQIDCCWGRGWNQTGGYRLKG